MEQGENRREEIRQGKKGKQGKERPGVNQV